MLHFNVADWGDLPPPRSKGVFVAELLAVFALALMAFCLLAGAFDPRIFDRSDVTDAGLTVLSQVPRLPGPRST